MENALNIIFSTENVRTLAIIVSVFCGVVWLKVSMNSSINSVNKRIDELKYNDFSHLTNAFKALTYVLEKNGSLSKEDKEYVDGRFI